MISSFGKNYLLSKHIYFKYDATYFLCTATYFLCAATYFLCTATYFLCAATYFLCVVTYFLCVVTYFLCKLSYFLFKISYQFHKFIIRFRIGTIYICSLLIYLWWDFISLRDIIIFFLFFGNILWILWWIGLHYQSILYCSG